MSPGPESASLLIGVDGGGSGVRALAVRVEAGAPRALGEAACEDYPPGDFEPLELEQQRAEQRAPAIGPEERAAGERRVAAAARCVARAAGGTAAGAVRVRVGVCLPGIKTADGRGTRIVKNGPRVPDYLARLEARLVAEGCIPEGPLGPLDSDGRCAAIGELHSAGGALAGVSCAYYVGGGSGLAEALVLDGELVELDAVGDWFPRAWELAAVGGASFEELVAPGAVNARWRADTDRGGDPRAFPEEHLETDVLAVAALTNLGTQLARLLHRRLAALGARGFAAERAVVGLRLGQLCADGRTEFFLRRTAERELARLICFDPDERLAERYLVTGEATFGALAPGLLVGSTLHIAPALGAAWCADERAAEPEAGADERRDA